MSDHNPFAAPDDQFSPAQENFPQREYGGIGRAAYFGISFLVGIVNNILQYAAMQAQAAGIVLVLGLVGLVISIVLMVQRLKNMGYSGWWAAGIIVPFLNILVALRCLAGPEGYADHKTLDTAGKVIIGLFLGLIGLLLVFVVIAANA